MRTPMAPAKRVAAVDLADQVVPKARAVPEAEAAAADREAVDLVEADLVEAADVGAAEAAAVDEAVRMRATGIR